MPVQPNRNITLAVALLLTLATPALAQKRPKPDAPPPLPTAREALAEAEAALKAGDESRAVKIYDNARTMKDFSASRPTPALVFAAGDYHFALGTKEGMEQALAIYAAASESSAATSIDKALSR